MMIKLYRVLVLVCLGFAALAACGRIEVSRDTPATSQPSLELLWQTTNTTANGQFARNSPRSCDPQVLAASVAGAANALAARQLSATEYFKNLQKLCGNLGARTDCLPGAENHFDQLAAQLLGRGGPTPGNMAGLFFEAKWATSAQNFGLKPLRMTMNEPFSYVDSNGVVKTAEAELLSIRLSDGAQLWDDVKANLTWNNSGQYVNDIRQARGMVDAAASVGRIPRYVVYGTPTCFAFTTLVSMGIQVVNANTGLHFLQGDVCP